MIASMELDCAAVVEAISIAPSRLTERKYIEYSSKHNDEDLAGLWFKLGGCFVIPNSAAEENQR